ncbi:DUF563 domain-containing protein [Arthrobacter sp. PM3]|uniref:glycosyltransferase family 61 protein n=1 Tax=Arthrobacter sp. PM3 TaxID=2017685 RepID=UPI001ABFA5A0|nr:glycosyltransferase family 61 protein [Arthrobacter sp. PM3]
MEAIEHHALALHFGERIEVLDICAEPHQELRVWEEFFPNADVHGIYSKNADSIHCDVPENTDVSQRFGAEFWADMALQRSPHLIISDGRLSHCQQLELFTYLFPVAEPGGVLVFEHRGRSGKSSADDENVLHALLYKIVDSDFDSSSLLAKRDDFLGYCARNIAAIEYIECGVVIRKRIFEQHKFTARPLSALAEETWTVDEPSTYSRVTPRIFGSTVMDQRTRDLIRTLGARPAPEGQVGVISGVTVLDGGIVITSDGHVIEESFINARHLSRRGSLFRVGVSEIYVSERSISAQQTLVGDTYAIVKQTWDSNFGHWLVDTLPRVANLGERFPLASLKFVLNGAAQPRIRDLHTEGLGLFGINADQVEFADWRPIFVEHAVYATPMTIPPFTKSPHAISILEGLVSRCSPEVRSKFSGTRRIYLTRNKYPRRNLVNEEDILPDVLRAGYEVIAPEELSLEEQIALFASASHVIGNMGAAFSSLAFSPSCVKVFVLATEFMLHDYFYDLVCHKNGEYWALQGTAVGSDLDIGSDFSVDANVFRELLVEFNR